MASKGNVKGRRKKSKKGTDNLSTGQYTLLPPPPSITTTLQPTTTNILPPSKCTILLPNAFLMPSSSNQFHISSSQNSLHSSSSSVPSTSSAPSLSLLRVGGPLTSPSIDSATMPNATTTVSQNLQFKEVILNSNALEDLGEEVKKPIDPCVLVLLWNSCTVGNHEGFQKSIEDWRQTQPALEDGTMVQLSPADMTRIWTTVVGGPKKGRTYGLEVNQSPSSSSPMLPNSASISQNAKEIEAMRTKIEELTQHCAVSDAKFSKFEALVKKHMP
ncbi:hypothetical protein FXO37_06122 [Capsicum annuum]|nr:hypothetical protein FXO37_06122 [Capsicum annuum]